MTAERDEAYDAQHARLLEGLAASIREKGLAQTQVTDIVRHARASRRTFYKHFPDKESCFVELTNALSMLLLERVDEAIDRVAPLEVQIDQAIDTYVDILVDEPNLTATWASPSVGERVIVAQREGLERYAQLLVSVVDVEHPDEVPLQREFNDRYPGEARGGIETSEVEPLTFRDMFLEHIAKRLAFYFVDHRRRTKMVMMDD